MKLKKDNNKITDKELAKALAIAFIIVIHLIIFLKVVFIE